MWISNIKLSLLWLLSAGAIVPLLGAVAPVPAADDIVRRVEDAPTPIEAVSMPAIEIRQERDGASPFKGLRRRGFAASQARLLLLTARKSDLELQLQFINQSRIQLANLTSLLLQQLDALRGQSGTEAQIAAIEQRLQAIRDVDKQLDLQAQRVNVQLQAVQAEIDTVQKILQKNIESGFKIVG